MGSPVCVHCDMPPDPRRRCPVLSGTEQCIPCETVEPRRASPIGRMIERVLPIDEDADRRVTAALSRAARTSRKLLPRPSLSTLAANLAVGGALCAAWHRAWIVGYSDGWLARHIMEQPAHTICIDPLNAGDTSWRPGCGRAWGGGE